MYFENSTNSMDTLFSILNDTRGNLGVLISAHIRSPVFFAVGGFYCIFGLLGNLLFMISFLFQKKMRTVSNYLICLQSSADFLTCLGFNMVFMIMVAFKWTMLTCWIWLVSIPLFPILSMYTQLCISVERMTLVTQPVNVYRRWFSKKLCTGYVIGGWLIHIAVFVIITVFGKMPPSEGNHFCSSYADLNVIDYQSLFIYFGFCVVYFGVAVAVYGKLLSYVRQRREQIMSTRSAFVKTSITLLKLCVLSMSTVVIPPVIMYIGFISSPNSDLSEALNEIAVLCTFPGFCVNPLFYSQRIKLFRSYVQKLFCPCKKQNETAPTSMIHTEQSVLSKTVKTQVQDTN